MTAEFRFEPLARADLPLLHEWRGRPHGTATVMTLDGPARLMVLERATYRGSHTPPQGIE